jgi:DNA invertase Pin-like site-specific DNA recombinase
VQGKFVAYYRVSTARQGISGLGLDAQRKSVADYLNGGAWRLLGEFEEVESGKNSARPQLAAALAQCKRTGATLVVANVSRLTRSLGFLTTLLDAGVEVRFCDMPTLEGPTGRFMLQQMAAVAELEAGLISQRTKAALAASKARGRVLGGYRGSKPPEAALGVSARQEKAASFSAGLAPLARSLHAEGKSLREIAAEFEGQHIKTARGGANWSATAVSRLLGVR